jgi:hypothetical protein
MDKDISNSSSLSRYTDAMKFSLEQNSGPYIQSYRPPEPEKASKAFFIKPVTPFHTLNTAFAVSQYMEKPSAYLLDRFSDLGGWWKETKNSGTELLGHAANLVSAPTDIQKGYLEGVAAVISKNDLGEIDMDWGRSVTPTALKTQSYLRQGLGHVGTAMNSTLGVLDFAEAYHDEGRFGPKTATQLTKTTLQGIAGGVSFGIGAGLAVAGGAVVGAPLIAGVALAAGSAYVVGKGFDYIASFW